MITKQYRQSSSVTKKTYYKAKCFSQYLNLKIKNTNATF